jgi:hypothetical protein
MGCTNPGGQVARAIKFCKLALSAERVSCHPSGANIFEVVLDFWKICVPPCGTFKLVPAGLNAVRVRELKWLDGKLGQPWTPGICSRGVSKGCVVMSLIS